MGDLRDIAIDTRLALEHLCRVAYSADYPSGDLLGNFRDRRQTRLNQSNPIMSAADLSASGKCARLGFEKQMQILPLHCVQGQNESAWESNLDDCGVVVGWPVMEGS